MLNPTTTITFVDGDFWNKDLNNFGPTVGFAWDLTKDGKTAVRGGYSLTFVNEEAITVGRSAARGNAGLTNTPCAEQPVHDGDTPACRRSPTPTFLSTRTLANQMALSATGILWGIDPDIQAPHVHQVSVGVQRELPWSTGGRGALRRHASGATSGAASTTTRCRSARAFLADFNRARSNGYLRAGRGPGASTRSTTRPCRAASR